MIKNKIFESYAMGENCYVVSDSSGEAVIIDCGSFTKEEFQAIADYISSEGLTPVHQLCTHFHFDHVMGLQYVFDAYGLQPEGSPLDEDLYDNVNSQLQLFSMGRKVDFRRLDLGRKLIDGNQILFGQHALQVIHTPGHSRGGLCFYCKEEGTLWSGDTLFRDSIGRTDLPGGDYRQLIGSISNRLFCLPDATKVYPGHGPSTTLAYEKAYNPYI